MKELINKNVGLIKILSVVLFVALMVFNVVITQNTHGNTSVDLSLSGLKAMAFGGGEGGGGGTMQGCGICVKPTITYRYPDQKSSYKANDCIPCY